MTDRAMADRANLWVLFALHSSDDRRDPQGVVDWAFDRFVEKTGRQPSMVRYSGHECFKDVDWHGIDAKHCRRCRWQFYLGIVNEEAANELED